MLSSLLLYVQVAFALVTLGVVVKRVLRKHVVYPPSPPGHWLLGNLLDMPRTIEWDKLLKWKDEYGGITYLVAFGKSTVFLNDMETIKDFFEKRAKNNSHRPQTVVVGELMGLNKTIIFQDYTDRYRSIRKFTQRALNPDASRKYQSLQIDIIKRLLDRLLVDPEDFREQCRLALSRMILMVTYGVDIKTADSEFIANAQHVSDIVNKSMMPGAHLVDLIPILKHLPKWFPFTEFHKIGDHGREIALDFATRPFAYVQRAMVKSLVRNILQKELLTIVICLLHQKANGYAQQSFVSDLLSDPEILAEGGRHSADTIEDIKWTAGTMFSAGIETSFPTILTFILLMALHPMEQLRAQQEIDKFTGGIRIVALDDRVNLPYVQALIREVFRWHVSVPLGVPRRSAADDEYKGYHIPADTVLIPNIWALSQAVPEPHKFNPDRFLSSDGTTDPTDYIFGFGRRICPGRHLAENFIFLVIANILSNFTISSPTKKQPDGLPSPSEAAFASAMISFPEPFACNIKPRTEEHAEYIITLVSEM
ncbi:hypothetical protein QCA50_011656 [Cerrena zonata]|uniref:Cytochrome P450 n=1 Tax=Cerrena zonata TaxID=2478898 RepID=A0AAW0G5L8_9APHY